MRQSNFFVWQFFIPYGLIASLSFAVIRLETFNDRMNFLLALLLTSVAFQYSIADQLPKIPYTAVITAYLLSGFFLQIAMFILVVVIPPSDPVFRWSLLPLLILWFTVQCCVMRSWWSHRQTRLNEAPKTNTWIDNSRRLSPNIDVPSKNSSLQSDDRKVAPSIR